jgi:hypothetical protein
VWTQADSEPYTQSLNGGNMPVPPSESANKSFCVRKGAGRVSRCSMDGFTCGQLEHFDCDVLCEDCTMKFPVFEGYFDGFVNEEMKRPSQPFQLRG